MANNDENAKRRDIQMTTDYENLIVWRRICKTTLSNYINMEKRLSDSKKMSDFVLVYYSIFLIIHSLTALYFEWYNSEMCEYFGIVLSVIMLAYSLINSNANYAQRIERITKAINDLKTLKRSLKEEQLDLFISKYNEIVDNVEFRNDIDFFNTVKSLCKEKEILWFKTLSAFDAGGDEEKEKIRNYLSEISPILLQMKIIAGWLLKLFLFVLPIVIMVICIIF